MRYKGYTGTSEYSVKEGCCHGQIEFIGDLITYEGETQEELEIAFKEAVDGYIEHCKETGRPAQMPRQEMPKTKKTTGLL